MKRAPTHTEPAPDIFMESPTLRQLTYAPLPYQTHPVDTYDGPQGWGPFYGPWTPWDWHDPAVEISDRYDSGESNEWEFSPDYDVITLFTDNSLDYGWNTSYDVAAEHDREEQQTAYTSTIANVVPQHSGSVVTRLRDLLMGSRDV